jgi:NADPH-dependent 2,4-dienoyl-CoA reductase/sulfur reductase-like enzyme
VLADAYPNFSTCGLPLFLSGETPEWHQLAHRTEFDGIKLLLWHTATSIDPAAKMVEVVNRENEHKKLQYDRLLIATRAVPSLADIPGIDLPGVHRLHTMQESFGVQRQLVQENPHSVIIVGAGYIGVEMADALVHRRLEVSLVGRPKSVLETVDPELGALIEKELRRGAFRSKRRYATSRGMARMRPSTKTCVDHLPPANWLTLSSSQKIF